jgi:hypothetical protein
MRAIRWLVPLLLPLALAASCSEPAAGPDGARALERIRQQVAFGPRIPGSPGHAATRAWLVAELERLGARIERQSFMDTVAGQAWPMENIVARFGPEQGRRIALYAHYDTRPWSDMDPSPERRTEPVPGANDAGSGVAVLLEVAELMKVRRPAVGVDLVFLDGEDLGRPDFPDEYCRGSRHYARRLPPAGDASRPVAGFLFDMVGDRDLGIWDEGHSAARATNLVNLVHEAARATGAAHFHEGVRHTLIDDHVPLLDAGLPAIDIIDFDYPAWHTTSDLPDRCSAESLAEVARVAAWIVYSSSLAKR